jgi:hypothetical protein
MAILLGRSVVSGFYRHYLSSQEREKERERERERERKLEGEGGGNECDVTGSKAVRLAALTHKYCASFTSFTSIQKPGEQERGIE